MLLDFVISYILVGIWMGICSTRFIFRDPHYKQFPMSPREWAGLISKCIIWPHSFWKVGEF